MFRAGTLWPGQCAGGARGRPRPAEPRRISIPAGRTTQTGGWPPPPAGMLQGGWDALSSGAPARARISRGNPPVDRKPQGGPWGEMMRALDGRGPGCAGPMVCGGWRRARADDASCEQGARSGFFAGFGLARSWGTRWWPAGPFFSTQDVVTVGRDRRHDWRPGGRTLNRGGRTPRGPVPLAAAQGRFVEAIIDRAGERREWGGPGSGRCPLRDAAVGAGESGRRRTPTARRSDLGAKLAPWEAARRDSPGGKPREALGRGGWSEGGPLRKEYWSNCQGQPVPLDSRIPERTDGCRRRRTQREEEGSRG